MVFQVSGQEGVSADRRGKWVILLPEHPHWTALTPFPQSNRSGAPTPLLRDFTAEQGEYGFLLHVL